MDAKRTIVIVGGVAGGASAATRARRMNEQATIVLLEKDEYVSFANCGLPYYLGGEIAERNKLLVATPEFLARRFRLDVRTRHEALRIDRAAKKILVMNHRTAEQYWQLYDKLILSPGATPIVPRIDGVSAPNVFTLRNLDDTDRIAGAMRAAPSRKAVVVGAGYIGLEMVEQLVHSGYEVALSELQPQVLPLFDHEMVQPIHEDLTSRGVRLCLGDPLQRIITDANGPATHVELASGRAIGGRPGDPGIGCPAELAVGAGRRICKSVHGGGIQTNRQMQTNDPDVYAVGDAAEYVCGPLGTSSRIALAGPANRAGRLAGEHAATDRSSPMSDVMGTAIVRVFDLTAGMTGLTTQMARRSGQSARSVTIVANQHAGYYPGASPLVLKLLYDPATERVLGAQCVGKDGVDKRIDVIATALALKATVRDLAGLDLAYAPPFGSAKDPVHLAAFAAGNQLDGLEDFLDADADLAGKQVVDVRTPAEVSSRPLAGAPGAINIPLDSLRERLNELDPQADTVVSCGVGLRAHVAARILRQHGFARIANLSGGATLRNRAVADNPKP